MGAILLILLVTLAGGCNRKTYKTTTVTRDTLYTLQTHYDTIKVMGKDSIETLLVTATDTVIKEVYITVSKDCKTRYQTKFEYKTIRDTVRLKVKAEVKKEKIQAVADVRKTRIENRSWFWTFVLISITFILGYLTRKRLNQ